LIGEKEYILTFKCLVSGTLGNATELTQQFKSRKQTPQENHGLPQINTKLIHGILANPEEERSKQFFFFS